MKMELTAYSKDNAYVDYADHIVFIPSAKVITGFNAEDNSSFCLPLDEVTTISIRTRRKEDMP